MVRKNPPHFKALTAVGALMTLINFTLSNVRRFYSSMGNSLAVKGLRESFIVHLYANYFASLCSAYRLSL